MRGQGVVSSVNTAIAGLVGPHFAAFRRGGPQADADVVLTTANPRSHMMNQHASNNSIPPSVGPDVSGIETLLNRNLPEVFGEGDPARRRSAIQELYTEDCVLYVPSGTYIGHDALDKFAGDLRATHPHYVYTPYGAPQVLHNSGRLAWGWGPKGEKPPFTGVDFIIARGGKIAALYAYLDSPPT
jgi:SnoaL-like domain